MLAGQVKIGPPLPSMLEQSDHCYQGSDGVRRGRRWAGGRRHDKTGADRRTDRDGKSRAGRYSTRLRVLTTHSGSRLTCWLVVDPSSFRTDLFRPSTSFLGYEPTLTTSSCCFNSRVTAQLYNSLVCISVCSLCISR